MLHYDKDMERAMQFKKREVLQELENAKLRILKELSGVDKLTLTRLREILVKYDTLENTFAATADKYFLLYEELSDACKRSVGALTEGLDNLRVLSDAVNNRLSVENFHNNEGFMNEIARVCKTYNDKFSVLYYGNEKTAYDAECEAIDGKFQIDCSSFIHLLINGVTFENSRYNGNEENTVDAKFFNGVDGMNCRYANQMAEYLFTHGYTFVPNADFSNIEPGDILFFSFPDETGEFHDNAFMKIDHVAMFLTKYNENYYQTIQYHEEHKDFVLPVGDEYMNACVLVARVPFGNISNRRTENMIADPNKALTVDGDTTIGYYNLNTPFEVGAMYTCHVNGKIDTEGGYFTLMGAGTNGRVTLFSNYGDVWTGNEEEHKFTFICPEGFDNLSTLFVCIGGTDGNAKGSVTRCELRKGYYNI